MNYYNYLLLILICITLINLIYYYNIENKEYIIIGLFVPLLIYKVVSDRRYYSIIKRDFTSKEFLGYFTFITLLTLNGYILNKVNSGNEKYQKTFESYKEAYIAFILAYSARIDLVFAPFFAVYVFNYFYK